VNGIDVLLTVVGLFVFVLAWYLIEWCLWNQDRKLDRQRERGLA
jgi:phage shock protein PspC (stress-responsive transcriptional regulator)